jgi:hypothetical protein
VLAIVITAVWLLVVFVVVGACRIAAFADQGVEEMAPGRRSSRRPDHRPKTEGSAEVLLLPSQPAWRSS